MNLLIHDLAAAIEREASQAPRPDRFELTADAITVEVAQRDEQRRERAVARVADAQPLPGVTR